MQEAFDAIDTVREFLAGTRSSFTMFDNSKLEDLPLKCPSRAELLIAKDEIVSSEDFQSYYLFNDFWDTI